MSSALKPRRNKSAVAKLSVAIAELEARKALAALIDELGALTEEFQVAGVLTKVKRAEALRKQLATSIDLCTAADKAWNGAGQLYECVASERANSRRVTKLAELQARLGKDFLGVCAVTLTSLENMLPAHEAAAYTVDERRGPRTIQTFRRAVTAAKAAA